LTIAVAVTIPAHFTPATGTEIHVSTISILSPRHQILATVSSVSPSLIRFVARSIPWTAVAHI
jgi:hypothetical protein